MSPYVSAAERRLRRAIGREVKAARERQNLPYRHVAERVGIRRPQDVLDYEKGLRPWTPELLTRFEQALGLADSQLTVLLPAPPPSVAPPATTLSALDVIEEVATVWLDEQGNTVKSSRRVHFRPLGAPLEALSLLRMDVERLRQAKIIGVRGGRLGHKIDVPGTRTLAIAFTEPVQPGQEHECELMIEEPEGDTAWAVYPEADKRVRKLTLRLWAPPVIVNRLVVERLAELPPGTDPALAVSGTPVPLTAAGFGRVEIHTLVVPWGYGARWRVDQHPRPPTSTLATLQALAPPLLAQRLREIRGASGWKQTEIAQRLGYRGSGYLSRVEQSGRASEAVLRVYAELASGMLPADTSEGADASPRLVDCELSGSVTSEGTFSLIEKHLSFIATVDGMNRYVIERSDTPQEVEDDALALLEGGTLERLHSDGELQFVANFAALRAGDRHELVWAITPDDAVSTLDVTRLRLPRLIVKLWLPRELGHSFSLYRIDGIPPQEDELLTTYCTELPVRQNTYMRCEFTRMQQGYAYGVHLQQRDTES